MELRNFLPRCIVFELRILNDSIGIRSKNVVHLDKKFLAAIFSVIVYCSFQYEASKNDKWSKKMQYKIFCLVWLRLWKTGIETWHSKSKMCPIESWDGNNYTTWHCLWALMNNFDLLSWHLPEFKASVLQENVFQTFKSNFSYFRKMFIPIRNSSGNDSRYIYWWVLFFSTHNIESKSFFRLTSWSKQHYIYWNRPFSCSKNEAQLNDILHNFRICTIVIEALMTLERSSGVKMKQNTNRSRLFRRIAESSIE